MKNMHILRVGAPTNNSTFHFANRNGFESFNKLFLLRMIKGNLSTVTRGELNMQSGIPKKAIFNGLNNVNMSI